MLCNDLQGTEYMDEDEVASWMATNAEDVLQGLQPSEPSAPRLPHALQVTEILSYFDTLFASTLAVYQILIVRHPFPSQYAIHLFMSLIMMYQLT